MESSGKGLNAPELFNESTLLSYVDGNARYAKNILSIAIAEIHDSLNKINAHLKNKDLNGAVVDIVNIRGVAGAMASNALYFSAIRAADLAAKGNINGVRKSCKEMMTFLKELEETLKSRGWLKPPALSNSFSAEAELFQKEPSPAANQPRLRV